MLKNLKQDKPWAKLRISRREYEAKHRPGSVHGDFRFDQHNGLETSKRGLFDRTKFR